jgi:hypothetical protein
MTIKKLLLTTSVITTLVASTCVFAADNKAPGSGPNPFTDCGIGAALFSDTKWAAVTSNIIWDIGITAIISATASPQTCQGNKVVAALFIRDTYANLAEETAAGQGEHLTTVLNIYGCDGSRHASAVKQIRGAMGQAVAAPGYVDQAPLVKDANFYSIIDNAVSTNCSV